MNNTIQQEEEVEFDELENERYEFFQAVPINKTFFKEQIIKRIESKWDSIKIDMILSEDNSTYVIKEDRNILQLAQDDLQEIEILKSIYQENYFEQ